MDAPTAKPKWHRFKSKPNRVFFIGYTPALNANGNGYATIGFKVQDNGGTANSGVDTGVNSYVLTFNVTPVNGAPTISAPSGFTVTEDVAGNLLFTGTPFADVDSASLTITLSMSDGAISGLAATGTHTCTVAVNTIPVLTDA
ncbi:MAG: hypothetical protein ACKO69_03565, partial [Limnohabitans sp.]